MKPTKPTLLFAAAILALAIPTTAMAQLPPVPSTPDTDSDTEGHETENPSGKDHAESTGWRIGGGGPFEGEDLRLAWTRAEMDEDGGNRADASAFRAGPVEPATAHTDSREGPGDDAAFDGTTLECIGGIICFGAFYAEAKSEEGSTSRSTARSGIFSVCLLPFDNGETTYCDGGAGIMMSESEVERNNRTGETESRSWTVPLFLCLSASDTIAEAEACGAIFSESSSTAEGRDDGDADRHSAWSGQIFVSLFGQEVVGDDGEYDESESFHLFSDDPPSSFEDAEGCPGAPHPEGGCGHTNQGESFEFPGGAAARQEALHIEAWDSEGRTFFLLHAGVAETLARFQDEVLPFSTENPSLLASTGVGVAWLLALAIGLMLTGGVLRRYA